MISLIGNQTVLHNNCSITLEERRKNKETDTRVLNKDIISESASVSTSNLNTSTLMVNFFMKYEKYCFYVLVYSHTQCTEKNRLGCIRL